MLARPLFAPGSLALNESICFQQRTVRRRAERLSANTALVAAAVNRRSSIVNGSLSSAKIPVLEQAEVRREQKVHRGDGRNSLYINRGSANSKRSNAGINRDNASIKRSSATHASELAETNRHNANINHDNAHSKRSNAESNRDNAGINRRTAGTAGFDGDVATVCAGVAPFAAGSAPFDVAIDRVRCRQCLPCRGTKSV